MRPLLIVALAFVALLPLSAAAQFGPIVPTACQDCACGFAGVLAIIQNVVNFIIALAIIAATIIIAWGGFLYIISPTNPGHRSLANKMLINAVIGLVITLSAWLIVDFVMKTLYGGQFGPWNSILYSATDGNSCIQPKENSSLFSGGIFSTPGANPNSGGGGSNCPAAPRSEMVAFPASATSGETEYATPRTVENFMSMRAAATRDGIDLKVTDGHRPEEEQVQLWNRYQNGGGVAARPCSQGGNGSNHNSGQAIDIAVGCANGNSNCNTATYRWLKQHGAQYGFRNAIQSDPVHWSPSGR